jgi:acyl transferase domain-containing protein/acyl carrier protein
LSVTRSDHTRKLLENALVAIDLMQQRLTAVTSAQREPIAIVGAACRFPGGVHDLPSYWRLLHEGRSGVSDLSRRFEFDDYYDRDPNTQGKIACRWGGLLDDIEQFDAQFFGISPKAAVCMDPQQRLMLEVAWEAIENAGYDPMNLPSKQGGVFVATGPNEYAPLLLSKGFGMEPSGNMATGNSASVVAGRLSYLFGWMGPAVVVDTACSSSLVAVHMACQSLRSQECDLAIAGGVNLMLSPLSTVVIGKNGMLAADSRCKVFDAAADGYIRSEGAAILVFKRLSDARAHRDQILAVVRGSAVTHNGRSQGITAPSAASQEAVIGKALDQAGLTPDAVSYVETHGTGTALGDPIEVASVAATYGGGRSGDRPLLIGSVKANIGHCEAAAGAAGLLKLVLCLQHRSIPPQINLTRISPHLEQWLQGDGPMRVSCAELPWASESTRFGAVSSFGFSGTNAHAIVEQAPDIQSVAALPDRNLQLLTLSAKTFSALGALALRYADRLREATDPDLGNICFTANAGRSRFSHRLAVWGDRPALVRALTNLATGEAAQNGATGQVSAEADAVPFYFGGDEPDSPAGIPAGIEDVYRTSSVFRSHIDFGEQLAHRHLGASVCRVLFETERSGDVYPHALRDLASFVLKFALAKTLMAWGVGPSELCGRNADEYLAASLAGAMSTEAAARLLLARNDAAEFARLAKATEFVGARILLRSADTGRPLGAEIGRQEFWCSRRSVPAARKTGPSSDLDRGGYRVSFGDDFFNGRPRDMQSPSAAVKPEQMLWSMLLSCVGHAHLAGAPVDYAAIDDEFSRHRVPLPTYPFARKRYWPDGDAKISFKAAKVDSLKKPMEVEMDVTATHPLHLADHRLAGEMVFPGAAHLAMAFEAVARTGGNTDITFVNVAFPQVLSLAPDDRRIVRYRFSPGLDGRINCRGESREAADSSEASNWTWHLAADLVAEQNREDRKETDQVLDFARECSIALASKSGALSSQQFYDRLEQFGYQLGPSFRWVMNATSGPSIATGALRQPEVTDATSKFALSATLLDTCFQVASAALPAGVNQSTMKDMYLPFSVDRIRLTSTSGEPKSCMARLRTNPEAGRDDLVHDIVVVDEDGRPLLSIEGFRSRRRVTGEANGSHYRSLVYDIRWREAVQPPSASALSGAWLIFTDGPGVGDALARRLRRDGVRVHCVRPANDIHLSEGDLRINPDNPEHMGRLLAHIPNFNHAVHLWALDLSGTLHGGLSGARTAASTWVGILHFAQALTEIPPGKRQLWICTRQSQAVLSTDRVEVPDGATLWGLGRTLMHEVRDLQTVLVDLDGNDPAGVDQLADALHRELGFDAGHAHERALRRDVRYEPRLLRRAAAAIRAPALREDVTYLITGGLGGLGLACANRFIQWGARNLALLSRSKPSDEALQVCDELERRGARITRMSADVGSREALKAALDEIRARGPKLGGIVHAAGVLNDGVMVRQSVADFEEVMRPKVDGAWNLHDLTRDAPLDFFISFSSMAALLGSPAQAAYAAANAYLDALALYRRSVGLPATSVNWGAWSEIGMAARNRSKMRAVVQETHGGMMSPRQALDVFALAFEAGAPPSIAIGNLSAAWLEQVGQHAASMPAMLRELMPSSGASKARQRSVAPLGRDLERLSPEQRKCVAEEYVAKEVRLVLGLGADQELDPLTPLLDSGLDSLAAIELRDRLAEATSAAFPASLLFDNPSIAKLADVILSAILPSAESTRTVPDRIAAANESKDDGLEQLSSAELHSLLAEELRGETESGWL